MKAIAETISKMYRQNIYPVAATKILAKKCTKEELARFIIDAFNRGWISRFNLGIDEDGNII
jgi:hypothetical protein